MRRFALQKIGEPFCPSPKRLAFGAEQVASDLIERALY